MDCISGIPYGKNDITDKDVVCGRGGTINSHKGNIFFRSLVVNNKQKYLISSKLEKKLVAKFIVDVIRRRGGRFLKWSSDQPNELVDIGDFAAMDKTCQALREGLNVRASNKERKNKRQSSLPSPSNEQSPSSNDEHDVFNVNHSSHAVSVHQSNHSNNYTRDYTGTSHSRINYYHAFPNPCVSLNNYQGTYQNGQQSIYEEERYNPPVSKECVINTELVDKKSVQLLGRCTCKKSYCLKLYCQCFSNSMYCTSDHCRCTNCYNSLYYNQMVHEAKERIANRKRSVA